MSNFWNKYFKKKEQGSVSEEDTIPVKSIVDIEDSNEITRQLSSFSNVQLHSGRDDIAAKIHPPQLLTCCAQSVGKQRDHNEDAMFSLTSTLACNGGTIPFGLYMVADGMGGHQHGEVASEIAIRTLSEYVVKNIFLNIINLEQNPPGESIQEIMRKGIQLAHDRILAQVTGGGTTLTTVTIIGYQMTIAHVGDSRIYSIDLNGKLKPLTRDHSLVKRLEELGQLTPEEAAVDPRRNVLIQGLGQGTHLEPEVITTPIQKSGYLLVCSDGLWGVVPEETIGEIVTSGETLQSACQELVNASNEAGGPDNITAILIKLPDSTTSRH